VRNGEQDPLEKYERVLPFRRRRPPEPAPAAEAEDRGADRGNGATIAALVCFLVVLVAGGVWLMSTLRDVSRLQDCAMQGRRNCAPIEVPTRER
jgi:hypothetical protein